MINMDEHNNDDYQDEEGGNDSRHDLKGGSRGGKSKKSSFGRASDCRDVAQAKLKRIELQRTIKKKVEEIQDASIGAVRIRELNDEINNILKSKHQWEKRIVQLGGPDFTTRKKHEYLYFGACRELPEVREMIAKPVRKVSHKRSRSEIMTNITPRYYNCDVTASLLSCEKAREEALRKQFEPQVLSETKSTSPPTQFDQLLLKTASYSSKPFLTKQELGELDTCKSMEAIILERRKKKLMDKYLLH